MKNITRTLLLGSALITAACAPQGEKTVSYVQSKPQVDGAPAKSTTPSTPLSHNSIERTAVNAHIEPSMRFKGLNERNVLSFDELLKIEGNPVETDLTEEDKLRLPAMKETALTFGAQAGLAYASWELNKILETQSAQLDKIYNFNSIMSRGPDGVMVLPPVISEAKSLYEITDEEGKSLRVADQAYEIIEQARFTSVAPMWHTYLVRNYTTPSEPPSLILPTNDAEREHWQKHLKQGWDAGIKQAKEIFDVDLNRLDRDYQGMIRYLALLNEGKVSDTVVAKGMLGTTGDGQAMRVNDRTIRIMKDPELNLKHSEWSATIKIDPPSKSVSINSEKPSQEKFPRPILRRY